MNRFIGIITRFHLTKNTETKLDGQVQFPYMSVQKTSKVFSRTNKENVYLHL